MRLLSKREFGFVLMFTAVISILGIFFTESVVMRDFWYPSLLVIFMIGARDVFNE